MFLIFIAFDHIGREPPISGPKQPLKSVADRRIVFGDQSSLRRYLSVAALSLWRTASPNPLTRPCKRSCLPTERKLPRTGAARMGNHSLPTRQGELSSAPCDCTSALLRGFGLCPDPHLRACGTRAPGARTEKRNQFNRDPGALHRRSPPAKPSVVKLRRQSCAARSSPAARYPRC